MSILYKDKNWLENKYNKDKLNDLQIAKLCSVNDSTIGKWRSKFGINTRLRGKRSHLSKGNRCDLSQEAVNWINGALLGDGGLLHISDYSAAIDYGSKFPKYLQYVSDALKSFGIKQTGKICKIHDKKYDCYFYCYTSLCYEELLFIRNKWYPKGKKIVPRDLKLTPLTCQQWYLGDGSLSDPKYGKSSIVLHTTGFPVSDVRWLVDQLINLGFKATRQPSTNAIHISTKSTQNFLNYIGPCPAKDYNYKWKLSQYRKR